MAKFNLYKILYDQKEELIEKFESVGLSETKSLDEDGFTLKFFFSHEPEKVNIWWIDTYAEFLELENIPKNIVHFGAMLVYDDTVCYAVSLGKSHFYLKNYCDKNFGLNLGERIIDVDNLKIKNSKHYKNKKSKSITSYQANTTFDYDSGESMHYIKAKTINEGEWGLIASFGTSVQFSLDISARNLTTLVRRIERKLSQDPIMSLPKSDLVVDKEIKDSLDLKLSELILSSSSDVMSMDEFSVSGVDFVFSDKDQYRFYVKGDSKNKSDVLELSIKNLAEFVQSRGISLRDKINDIMVSIKGEHGGKRTESIKKFLDYIDDDRYCLMDGAWHMFNESYLKYINQEVDKVVVSYDSSLDVVDSVNEDAFIDELSSNHGYTKTHKTSTKLIDKLGSRFTVEMMDMFKDGSVFFVKAGNPQKLNYVIDQSINTLQLLQNNTAEVEVNGVECKIENVCLWIIIDRVNNVNSLSELNSIIFLMKLAYWRKKVNEAGYKPVVHVNYRRKAVN